ncbi:hypothetical protein SprV_0401648500 [Sparganum proliferum]
MMRKVTVVFFLVAVVCGIPAQSTEPKTALAEILKGFGAQVFENILQEVVSKLLAIYMDNSSESELKALAAAFTGLVKAVVKLATGSERPGTIAVNFLHDVVGNLLKFYGTSKLENTRQKINQVAKETDRKLVNVASKWFITYILRKGSRSV